MVPESVWGQGGNISDPLYGLGRAVPSELRQGIIWECGIRRHCSDVYVNRNVLDLKWRLLANVLARVGVTSETVANWSNSRPWIGLFQGAKSANVPKFNLEFA